MLSLTHFDLCGVIVRTSDFDYHLPPEMIAQTPIEPRDHSRLLVLHRDTNRMEHRRFYEVVEYLREGDLLVLNDSRVIPARLHGRRDGTGGRVEVLLLRRLEPCKWEALAKPGKRLRPGARVIVVGKDGAQLEVEVLEDRGEGLKLVQLSSEEGIEQAGEMPLPPYVHTPLADSERYQTVYSRAPGSVAAPTAGLHFTQPLLERINGMGVRTAFVTLHVGLDTFRPVAVEDLNEHRLHSEAFTLPETTAVELNAARREGRRVIAVGTTSVRTLEQVSLWVERQGTDIQPVSAWAELFILPGHRFRTVQAMITNFHLPRSTLLMLVSAFAGRERILATYQEAIAQGYRFYSFGDGMLIL
jgi:S-adenosylmethionine:tRNA ribosyltransferase-isomerase